MYDIYIYIYMHIKTNISIVLYYYVLNSSTKLNSTTIKKTIVLVKSV